MALAIILIKIDSQSCSVFMIKNNTIRSDYGTHSVASRSSQPLAEFEVVQSLNMALNPKLLPMSESC